MARPFGSPHIPIPCINKIYRPFSLQASNMKYIWPFNDKIDPIMQTKSAIKTKLMKKKTRILGVNNYGSASFINELCFILQNCACGPMLMTCCACIKIRLDCYTISTNVVIHETTSMNPIA